MLIFFEITIFFKSLDLKKFFFYFAENGSVGKGA